MRLAMTVNVDRTLASRGGSQPARRRRELAGLAQQQLQVAPNFWLNPRNGVSYPLVVQTPTYRIDSAQDLVDRCRLPHRKIEDPQAR